jgi:hypothetical protein
MRLPRLTSVPDRDLVQAYQLKLSPEVDEGAKRIIGDLAIFCGDDKTTAVAGPNGTIDPIAMGVAEGRRQVFQRIKAMLALDQSTAWQLIERERQMRGQQT